MIEQLSKLLRFHSIGRLSKAGNVGKADGEFLALADNSYILASGKYRIVDLGCEVLGELARERLEGGGLTRILDGQNRLRTKGLQQIDRVLGELARRPAAHHQRSHDPLRAQQRNGQDGAEASPDDDIKKARRIVPLYVRDL